MPPISKRLSSNTSKIRAKRSKFRVPLSEIQQVNYLSEDDGNADAIGDGAAPVAAAKSAPLQENAGAVAANAGATGLEDEDEDEVDFTPDEKLPIADHWLVKLLQKPNAKALVSAKKEWDDAFEYISPFDDSLNCRYTVEKDEWHSMKVFKHIMKDEVRFRVGDFVTIRPNRDHPKGSIKIPNDDGKEKILTPRNDWVARIVELRADSPFKVFALVAWLYWPEDLYTAWSKGETKAKNGKKGYHGDYELIASNHLDIMDVHSFDNNFNHLIEQDYEDHEGDGELKECYYRQMYDYRTGKLTELKRYCKCSKFNKPDQPLVQCTNALCGIWHHQACIVDDVLSKKWIELRRANPSLRSKKDAKSLSPPYDINSIYINDRRYRDYLHGKLLANVNQVQVTDIRRHIVTNVPIKCLKCGCTFV